MKPVTLGRKPTLGEVIDYYSRDDFLQILACTCRTRPVVLVISEGAHWEPDWSRCEVPAASADDLGLYVRRQIADQLPGIGPGDCPDYYPSFHQSVWRREGGEAASSQSLRDCVFEADPLTWRDAFQDV